MVDLTGDVRGLTTRQPYSVAVETDYAAASLGEAATFVRVLTSDLRAAARLADIGLRPGGGN